MDRFLIMFWVGIWNFFILFSMSLINSVMICFLLWFGKICCNDCNASYVRQTGRLLKTRVSEHRNHIRRNAPSVSVITNHVMHHNHEIDWNNVEVLDVEKYCHKRLVSEMLHIKRNGLNLQTNTDCLDRGYTSISNYLWTF